MCKLWTLLSVRVCGQRYVLMETSGKHFGDSVRSLTGQKTGKLIKHN
jgi:hypothetical protein